MRIRLPRTTGTQALRCVNGLCSFHVCSLPPTQLPPLPPLPPRHDAFLPPHHLLLPARTFESISSTLNWLSRTSLSSSLSASTSFLLALPDLPLPIRPLSARGAPLRLSGLPNSLASGLSSPPRPVPIRFDAAGAAGTSSGASDSSDSVSSRPDTDEAFGGVTFPTRLGGSVGGPASKTEEMRFSVPPPRNELGQTSAHSPGSHLAANWSGTRGREMDGLVKKS
jgi:hypothetical protein